MGERGAQRFDPQPYDKLKMTNYVVHKFWSRLQPTNWSKPEKTWPGSIANNEVGHVVFTQNCHHLDSVTTE